jgi:hypothetical protein
MHYSHKSAAFLAVVTVAKIFGPGETDYMRDRVVDAVTGLSALSLVFVERLTRLSR